MKTGKRVLSFVLVVALMVALLPAGALQARAATVTASGTCGDNLTWTLDSNGVLTISGTGAMTDYNYMPWYIYRSSVKKVVIKNGVTSIGYEAFSFCSRVKSVEIPASVTSIGEKAFISCDDLTSIIIDPDNTVYHSAGNCVIETESKTLTHGCKASVIPADGSVTSIGDSAFSYCTSLTDIKIPSSIKSIGVDAFYYCTYLTSVEISSGVTSIGVGAFNWCARLTGIAIPSSVTSIGVGAFSNCRDLSSITVDTGNEVYHSEGNCLIETASKTLIRGCRNSKIPADGSVTSIGSYAFTYCTGLTGIKIPSNITSIGSYAFDGTGLTSIEIPSGVTSIGRSAFYASDLTSITFRGATPPEMSTYTFSDITATAYYPGGELWTEDVRRDYGGNITWVKLSATIGDLDADGEITDVDAILLARYLAGWNVTIAAPEAMDIDGNGDVDDVDSILLDRYLAGWNVDTQIGK